MEQFETVECPHCGVGMQVGIDTSISSQFFTTDCEVCCRPFEVRVDAEPGAIVSIEVVAGS
jgi:hypothetical protein